MYLGLWRKILIGFCTRNWCIRTFGVIQCLRFSNAPKALGFAFHPSQSCHKQLNNDSIDATAEGTFPKYQSKLRSCQLLQNFKFHIILPRSNRMDHYNWFIHDPYIVMPWIILLFIDVMQSFMDDSWMMILDSIHDHGSNPWVWKKSRINWTTLKAKKHYAVKILFIEEVEYCPQSSITSLRIKSLIY